VFENAKHFLPSLTYQSQGGVDSSVTIGALLEVHLQRGKSQRQWLQGTHTWGKGSVQFRSAAFDKRNIINFVTKQAPLMRRSTIVNLPLQLVFPGSFIISLGSLGDATSWNWPMSHGKHNYRSCRVCQCKCTFKVGFKFHMQYQTLSWPCKTFKK